MGFDLGSRIRRAVKKLTRAIAAPIKKTYWYPKLDQSNPPSKAAPIEKIWSSETPAVSVVWMSAGLRAIFFI